MQKYDALSLFPDVADGLTKLLDEPEIHVVVFSNGTQSMISNSVQKSPELSLYSSIFKDIVVVDDVQR